MYDIPCFKKNGTVCLGFNYFDSVEWAEHCYTRTLSQVIGLEMLYRFPQATIAMALKQTETVMDMG